MSFIDQYNWKGIDFFSHKKYGKNFQSNNNSIAVNTLLVLYNSQKIRLAYE